MSDETPSDPNPAGGPARRKARPCPICGKMSLPKTYPFCSPRCRQVDLHRWLSGAYAIPVVETDAGNEEQ